MYHAIQRRLVLMFIAVIASLTMSGAMAATSLDLEVAPLNTAQASSEAATSNDDACEISDASSSANGTPSESSSSSGSVSQVNRSLQPSEPEPEPAEAATPVRFKIPSLDVDEEIEPVSQTENGEMAAPREWNDVAWYEPGPRPGAMGNAVIAGHYDSPWGQAVFYRIDSLEPGDEIIVEMDDGEELRFQVTETMRVKTEDAPLQDIFGPSSDRNLNLITCYGVFDSERNLYDERLVVFTELIED